MKRLRTCFGKRVAAACAMHDMSMGDLAQKVGVTPKTFSRYIVGDSDPRASLVVLVAQQLDVSTDYLLGRESS